MRIDCRGSRLGGGIRAASQEIHSGAADLVARFCALTENSGPSQAERRTAERRCGGERFRLDRA